MPRIEAPTVAEHREMRRREVIRHAAELLVTEGPAAVSPAAVARATGIARTSVYQYFPTSAELIAAAVEDLLASAHTEIQSAVAAASPDPGARLTAYVTTTLSQSTRGHGSARAFDAPGLPDACRARLHELHDALAAPLEEILRDLGVDHGTATMLVQGTLSGASALIEHGAPLASVTREAISFIRGGLGLAP